MGPNRQIKNRQINMFPIQSDPIVVQAQSVNKQQDGQGLKSNEK
jgi:hypothetical protein